MFKNLFLFVTLFLVISLTAKAQHIELLQQGKQRTSIRGLSVVDDKVAWVSGSRGSVGITADGGKTWAWQTIKGYERADFRDVEAFSDKEAVIISSGTPALILKTTDGGTTWQEKYRNTDTAYFLDAMDFDNPKHGIVLGDPIKNKFLLLETNDAAETWHPFKNQPDALPGEAAFAASGTCLRVNGGVINIVTGGIVSRWFYTDMKGGKWVMEDLPLIQGKSSQGAFSIACKVGWVIVGGDYSKDKSTDGTVCFANINGDIRGTMIAGRSSSGYQSCIEYISGKTPFNSMYLSTGTSGSNFSKDGGQNWVKIDDVSYNVCRKAKKGKLVLLAGDGGKIGIFIPK